MEAEEKNTTARRWRERIVAQQASGQTIRAWCQNNGCHEHAFYWWRAKLGLSPVTAKRRVKPGMVKPVGFARVVVQPTKQGGDDVIRVSLLGGRELMLPASMPIEQLATLVRTIEGAA
jgi:hypothetical protein